MSATDLGIQLVDLAGEAVGRQPARDGIGFDEGTIDFLRLGAQDAVQADGSVKVIESFKNVDPGEQCPSLK